MVDRQGDAPHVVYGVQEDYRRLYKSNPEAALRFDMTLQSGYGLLKAGTVLSKNLSNLTTGGKGRLLPYNPTAFTGAENHPGRAYLVADTGATATVVYVTMDDSYKFKVGDDLIINDDTTSAENLGVITSIDRTTYPHMAGINVTAAIGGTAFTVARKGHVLVEAGDSSNNYSDAMGILEKSVDTGIGANAAGANVDIILSNVLLYEGMLTNLDAAAKTDIVGSSIGQFLMIK